VPFDVRTSAESTDGELTASVAVIGVRTSEARGALRAASPTTATVCSCDRSSRSKLTWVRRTRRGPNQASRRRRIDRGQTTCTRSSATVAERNGNVLASGRRASPRAALRVARAERPELGACSEAPPHSCAFGRPPAWVQSARHVLRAATRRAHGPPPERLGEHGPSAGSGGRARGGLVPFDVRTSAESTEGHESSGRDIVCRGARAHGVGDGDRSPRLGGARSPARAALPARAWRPSCISSVLPTWHVSMKTKSETRRRRADLGSLRAPHRRRELGGLSVPRENEDEARDSEEASGRRPLRAPHRRRERLPLVSPVVSSQTHVGSATTISTWVRRR
jgi:hypothetical protein